MKLFIVLLLTISLASCQGIFEEQQDPVYIYELGDRVRERDHPEVRGMIVTQIWDGRVKYQVWITSTIPPSNQIFYEYQLIKTK